MTINPVIRIFPTREELKVKQRTEDTTIIVARLISMSLVLAASVAALPYRADAQESQRSQHATSAEEVVQQFYDDGKEIKYKLLVTLRRENGVWKIDNVKGGD